MKAKTSYHRRCTELIVKRFKVEFEAKLEARLEAELEAKLEAKRREVESSIEVV